MRDYLEQAVTGDADAVAERLEGDLTEQQVQALAERERVIFGEGGEVQRRLEHLNDEAEQENYRRLLPGYVRRFCGASLAAARLAHRRRSRIHFCAGAPTGPRAADALLPALEGLFRGSARAADGVQANGPRKRGLDAPRRAGVRRPLQPRS